MSDVKVEMVELVGVDGLRSLGAGVMWPTRYRPHLLCAKRGKRDTLLATHGVHFANRDGDLVATATNGIGLVEISLATQGHLVPDAGATVPIEAMKILARAEGETATIWFHAPKVSILVDGSLHQFDAIAPELPFPKERLRAGKTWRAGETVLDASQLRRIAEAFDSSAVKLADGGKSILHVISPDDDDVQGWLSLRVDDQEDHTDG